MVRRLQTIKERIIQMDNDHVTGPAQQAGGFAKQAMGTFAAGKMQLAG